jgi:hypothetical protein
VSVIDCLIASIVVMYRERWRGEKKRENEIIAEQIPVNMSFRFSMRTEKSLTKNERSETIAHYLPSHLAVYQFELGGWRAEKFLIMTLIARRGRSIKTPKHYFIALAASGSV